MTSSLVFPSVNQENKNLCFDDGKSSEKCSLFLSDFVWVSIDNQVWYDENYPKMILGAYSGFHVESSFEGKAYTKIQFPEAIALLAKGATSCHGLRHLVLGSWLSRIPPKRKADTCF